MANEEEESRIQTATVIKRFGAWATEALPQGIVSETSSSQGLPRSWFVPSREESTDKGTEV